jgi:predicted GNAT family acetyltransferase
MRWIVEPDPRAYADRVLPWLAREPVLTTVPATILDSVLAGVYPRAWLAWLADPAGEVAGVALRTPPYGVVLTTLPAGAAAALVEVAGDRLPGAAGPRDDVEAFATGYARRHGARAARAIRQHLSRLVEPVAPPRPEGRLRPAGEDEAELAARWFTDFCAEAGTHGDPDPLAASRRVIGTGRLLFWVAGDRPVSMVAHRQTVAGVTRIGPVWTPPEHRNHGYAAAATAAVAGRLGAYGEVVLFADRANPTSTGIYERIGFRPVAEWDDWTLEY